MSDSGRREPSLPDTPAAVPEARPPRLSHGAKSPTVALWRPPSIDVAIIAGTSTGVLYITLTGVYNRFYQPLHTRPEEVGLDRTAILARTLWLVFLIVIAIGIIYHAWVFLRALTVETRRQSYVLGRIHDWASHHWIRATRITKPLAVGGQLAASLEYDQIALRALRNAWFTLIGMFIGASVLVLLAAYGAVDRRAVEVQQGIPVTAIDLFGTPAIDVSAVPVRVAWLDKVVEQELILNDPWLLYLGQSDRVAVFIACGRTVVTPPDKVGVITRSGADREDQRAQAVRKAFCDKVTAS